MAADPHPSTEGLATLGVADILDRFESGTLTSVALVGSLLERIAVVDDPAGPVGLRAIARLADDALSVAAERDGERARRPGARAAPRDPGAGEGQHRGVRPAR